ncbi:hypothetical protein JXA63_01870 [Candidatus Woesebacteria bacterium]|nr:hypothetical protein [Candidatus Woesebacteria bacterium]
MQSKNNKKSKILKRAGLILVLVLIIPAIEFLLWPGYFNMHDDLQVMRLLEMDKCLADGQIPCRWAPDMAYGYGQPMFNFYSVLPYYLGSFLRIITQLTYLSTAKMLFLISFILGAVGMYLLVTEIWGKKAGVLSAILYTYAPYHALDVYVRGALSESFALGLLPFLWHSTYLVVKRPKFTRIVYLAVSTAAVLTTHNISSMIYVPITLVWAIYWIIREKNRWKVLKGLVISVVLGVGLAAFFIIPAVYEQRLIQTEALISEYSDYHAHFVSLHQLFIDRSWGDGPSIFGAEDDLSFQIGWPHWWTGIIIGGIVIAKLLKKKLKEVVLPAILLFLVVVFSFLTHSRSVFFWEWLPLIDFVQFPWRFLGPVIFFLSFVGGYLATLKLGKQWVVLLVIASIVINLSYFTPVHYSHQVREEEKLTGVAFELQQKAAINDYLPKTAEMAPPAKAPDSPKLIEGEGQLRGFMVRSNRFSFDAEIYQDAKVEVPVMYFPDWIVMVDGEEVPVEIIGAHGLISFSVPEGKHIVTARFTNTTVRSVSNAITILSLMLVLAGLVMYYKKGRLIHKK